MIRAILKYIIQRLLIVGVIFVLLLPLYMYFSYDVEELNHYYPNKLIQHNKIISFDMKSSKPTDWVGFNEISHHLQWAIVLSEDWSFYQHNGIDVEQINTAFREIFTRAKIRGASTITQQMIKNVYLSEDRTLWRKMHEMILAQKVEKVLSKKKILEVYFNCIEYGPGIYGIKNASYHYFNKHPSKVTAKEAAFLAMLLPSPKRYYISFKEKKLTQFAHGRVNAILKKMRLAKILTDEEYEIQKDVTLSWEKIK